jgi:myosin-crossreactive antigen
LINDTKELQNDKQNKDCKYAIDDLMRNTYFLREAQNIQGLHQQALDEILNLVSRKLHQTYFEIKLRDHHYTLWLKIF